METVKKIVVTGAAGQIGYALLFRIASGQLLGKDVKIELRLLELEQSLSALQGVAMELEDCAFPLLDKIVCTSDTDLAMQDVNWALLIGSMPRKAGMERADLLQANGAIFKTQGIALNNHAASDIRILVIGNPCNTNCLIAMHHATDIPRDRFFAMTTLDENRAISALAKKANVPVTHIKNMIIWGNHSSTQYPDFYHAQIADKKATEIISDLNWLQNDFIVQVQQRGAQIIKARGASSAASAANAIIQNVQYLTNPTPENTFFSTAKCSEGQYGIDPGLIFSFPCHTDTQGKTHVFMGIDHNSFCLTKIQATLEELRSEKEAVRSLELI